MIINLIPIRKDEKLFKLSKKGDAITINDSISLDFGKLEEGDILPNEAIDCDWIVGDVKRENGEIVLSLLFPHGKIPDPAPQESIVVTHPTPINIKKNGNIKLPIFDGELL